MAEKTHQRKNIDIPLGLITTLDVAAAKVGKKPKPYLEDLVVKHLLLIAEEDISHNDKKDVDNTNLKFMQSGSY